MAHNIVAALSTATALLFAAATAPALAQGQPRPGPAQSPSAQSSQQQAAKPYKPVAIRPPAPVADPSFEAFRKQVAAIAEKKDRRALAALVAANFFWLGEKGDRADKKKPGIDNLAKAIELDAKDGSGWDGLAGLVADPTAAPIEERKGALCSPADPIFDEKEFDALTQATDTDDSDWAYPNQPGIEMRAGPQPNSPVVEKLGMHFLRVMENDNSTAQDNIMMLRIVAPSGKVGYVAIDTMSPLGHDQLCYIKEGANWKIAGFIGAQ